MKITRQTKNLINRGLDTHIRIGVTGLSRAGKTAFITSLVNQLISSATNDNLPLLRVQQQQRLLGARRVPQKNLLTPRFNLDASIKSLSSTPPQWPQPTRDVSEIRLAIKYKPNSRTRKLLSRTATLYLDIVDYPGEWLLDLPMLEMDFATWSANQLQHLEQIPLPEVKKWLQSVVDLKLNQDKGDGLINQISNDYTQLLLLLKSHGYHHIQPGRFVLPGELAHAPVLSFFPYVAEAKLIKGSALELLDKRYREYQNQVIKPFYKRYFSEFDRQIVLVDVLSSLNQGPHAFNDMQWAISDIMKSFSYGNNSILRRLFAPRTDKLLFAATKADHVTPDQHSNLALLLRHLVQPIWQYVSFENVEMECLPVASISATEAGYVESKGKAQPAISGTLDNGEKITLYPGEVPATLPNAHFWKNSGFEFSSFQPKSCGEGEALPHIAMDKAIEFLIGDKLR